MTIDNVAVGSVHETVEHQDDEIIVTEAVTMVLNRLGTSLEMRTLQRSVEGPDGRLRRVRLETTYSEQTVVVEGHVDGEYWVVISADTGATQRRPLEQPLLGPLEVRARLSSLDSIGDVVSIPTFLATTHQPGTIRAELTEREQFGDEQLRVIEQRFPDVPMALTVLVDDEGRLVVSRMPGPFGLTETMLADETAARLANAGGELSEDVFRATLLETGVRLPAPRDMEYIELELSHRNPALGWPDLNGPGQQVLERSPERLVLAVHRTRPTGSFVLGQPIEPQYQPFLEANSLLQVEQPELVELAREIVGDASDAWTVARRLERWVADHMRFDMGVVLAPSSEVLKNRRGTCSEYAILLTSLARAAGLPAQYLTGYVYAHGMFGGHAWTQVLIGEEWVALDAAIPADGPADAARFAFDWSSLNEGAAMASGPGLQMFGQIDARVLAWRSGDGELSRYPDGAPVPQPVDGRFLDRVQGIEWAPPAGWTIVDYDQTWPSNLVAAAENAQGERVELRWVTLNPWENAGGTDGDCAAGCGGDSSRRYPGPGGYWSLQAGSDDALEALSAGLILPSN